AAKIFSLIVKIGGLAFILFLPTTFSINFQLFSNIWILQTLPAVFLGLYTNWFYPRALLIGWAGGMLVGTWLPWIQHFKSSVYPFSFFGVSIPLYAAIPAIIVNLCLAILLTIIFRAIGLPGGQDATTPPDFETRPVIGSRPVVIRFQQPE